VRGSLRRPPSKGSRALPRFAGLALAVALAACDDQSYKEIGGEIAVLTQRTDGLVATATQRLRGHGRHAIPQIEIALHTASDSGRRNLIAALRAIGDPEAIPILRHFAVYDLSPPLQSACETVLQGWTGGDSPRAQAARLALARIAALRAAGEGPAPIRPTAL
jgi:hypothetical protein